MLDRFHLDDRDSQVTWLSEGCEGVSLTKKRTA
jgi:hypothetical protein